MESTTSSVSDQASSGYTYTEITGPKISSHMHSCSGVMALTIVGRTNHPSPSEYVPPATISASSPAAARSM